MNESVRTGLTLEAVLAERVANQNPEMAEERLGPAFETFTNLSEVAEEHQWSFRTWKEQAELRIRTFAAHRHRLHVESKNDILKAQRASAQMSLFEPEVGRERPKLTQLVKGNPCY